jgi:starch synthase
MAAESVPFTKTGEVAEVVGALTKTLYHMGQDVRVCIPCYSQIKESMDLEQVGEPFPVPMDGHRELATVYRAPADQVPVYLIDNPRYFGREIISRQMDDAEPFVFYCRAGLEMLRQPGIAWQPDVIHCHDWHTGVVPNWLRTIYRQDPFFQDTAAVFTIHRLAQQGIFSYRVLQVAGLEAFGFIHYPDMSDLTELVNLLGRGVYFSDAITTVSETYAQQIQTPEYGEQLDPLLCDKRDRLFGITNRIDTAKFDPSTDPAIISTYDATTLEQRPANKAQLQRNAGLLQDEHAPLIGMVSRLSSIKGFDLLAELIPGLMSTTPVQLVIQGVGDPVYHELFLQYRKQYAGRIAFQATFSESMERRIYAGSDIFLMPSLVEPCGLGQMIAMRYGAVPVVRATGGLADTVQDYDPATNTGTGFTFSAYDKMALFAAIVRAVETYRHRPIWRGLQQRGMTADLSWDEAAARYLQVYHWARQQRLNTNSIEDATQL